MLLREYISIFRKRWLTILLIVLASVASSAVYTLAATPTFVASTRMFFWVEGGRSVTELNQGSAFAENQLASYAEVATSPLVLDEVVDRLALGVTSNDLSQAVNVVAPPGTVVLGITVRDENSEQAANIANAIADELTETVSTLSPQGTDGSEAVQATVIAAAQVPTTPSSPDPARNVAFGLLVGLVVGLGSALLREALDTKVRDRSDIEGVTDATVLGSMAYERHGDANPVFMQDDPGGERAESMRRLRTNLQFVNAANRARSIVVTSSIPGEGKSTTAINLAISLASSGTRTVLVDADLRRPQVADYMGIEGRAGLTTVLIGRAEVSEVAQQWRGTSLDVLPSGQIPPNPSELLGSQAMAQLCSELEDTYDVVILDSPPLLPVTDAAILARIVGGALVVAGADRIHKSQLRDALQALVNVEGKIVGIVLNKVENSRAGSNYRYDSYVSESKRSDRQISRSTGTVQRHTWPGTPLAAQKRDLA